MKDLALMLKVGEMAKDVKRIQRWIDDYEKDRDKALKNLNDLLVANGGKELTLEEVLSVSEE